MCVWEGWGRRGWRRGEQRRTCILLNFQKKYLKFHLLKNYVLHIPLTGEPLRLVAHLGHRCWFCRLPSHQPSKHLSSSTPSQAFLEVSSHQLSPRDSSLKSLALPCPGFFLHLLVTTSVLCFCSGNAFRVPPFCLTFLLSILASLNLQGRHLLPAVIALQVPLKPDYPRRAFLNTWREAGVERHTRLHLPIHKHPFVPSLLLGQCLRWTW